MVSTIMVRVGEWYGVDGNNGDGDYDDGSSGDSDDGVLIVVTMAVVVITEVIDGDVGGDGDNEEGMSCGTCCFAYFSPAFSVPVLGLSLLSGSVVLIWGMPSSAQVSHIPWSLS